MITGQWKIFVNLTTTITKYEKLKLKRKNAEEKLNVNPINKYASYCRIKKKKEKNQ